MYCFQNQVLLLLFFILRYTKFGRNFYAVGGNRQSALMLGINVKRTRFMAHLICCLLAGIGGYVYFLHVGSGAASHASGITIVAMLCIFLVVQSVIIARKKKAEA